MTQVEFEKKLSDIKQQEEKYGVEIRITDLIDKDHLDCVWYGGEVGTIECKDGWIITIGAHGYIRLTGMLDGYGEVDIKDESNSGYVYREIGSLLNDEKLYSCLYGKADSNDWLCFENNNWFEVDLISPSGQWIDLCSCDNDNILSNNLLECFENIEDYFGYIEWVKNSAPEKAGSNDCNVPYERVVQILQDYVCNDAESAETDYVRDVLESVCGVTKEEAEALGFGYLFDTQGE